MPDNEVPMPKNIQTYVNTTLAWDNIDRLKETLSGAETSNRERDRLLFSAGGRRGATIFGERVTIFLAHSGDRAPF